MAENKATDKKEVSDAGSEAKKEGINISLSLNDIIGFGVRMVKSGLSLTRSIEDMIDHKVDELVKKDKLTREEALHTAAKLKTQLNANIGKFTGRIGDGVRATLNRMNIATMDDMRSIEKRLDKMLSDLESLNRPAGKPESRQSSKGVPAKPAHDRSKGQSRSRKPESIDSSGKKSPKSDSKSPSA